jgi:vacuolar-type H+-ATPase subunit H
MTNTTIILLAVFATLVILTICVVLSVRQYLLTKKIYASFAKLGYVVREDAKKYFDDAATKIVDTNSQFHGQYKQIVEEGTKSALADSGATMQQAIDSAQREASGIIFKAQTDAYNIIASSKNDARKEYQQSLDRSVDAIRWTMEQYVKQEFNIDDHQKIIKQLLEKYVNERR